MLNWMLNKLLKRAEKLSERQRLLHESRPPASEADALMREGYEAHVAGRLDAAESCYRKILFRQPDQAEALYLLGEIQAAKGNHDQAIDLMRKATSHSPKTAAFHAGLAGLLRQGADTAGAEAAYREAIHIEPNNAEYINDLGTLLQEQNRLPEALECYRDALKIDPSLAQALYNTATIYRYQGRAEEAAQLIEQALRQNPEYSRGFIELAELYGALNKPEQALEAYTRAFNGHEQVDLPVDAQAQSRSNYGDLLQAHRRHADAIAQYHYALQLQPDAFAVWVNMGNAQKAEKRYQGALESYLKAVELAPKCAEAFSNIGSLLKEHGNCAQAIEAYRTIAKLTATVSWPQVDEGSRFCELAIALALTRHAIELVPDSAGFLLNEGVLLEELGQFSEAMDRYERALELDPQSPEAHFNEGISLLRLGRLRDGWPHYEYRLRLGRNVNEARLKEAPFWHGQPLDNEVLLVHAEQGLGDTLQFIRYFGDVTERCPNVIFECQPAVTSLVETIPGITNVIASGQPLPKFDYQVPLLSLPRIFDTTLENIPARIPYILPDATRAARWRTQTSQYTELKVGIVWAGGAVHLGNRFRSCSLAVFAPLGSCRNVRFFSLQKGEPEKEAATPPPGFNLVNCSPQIRDFRDTATLIDNLDLVITVDTSVAHLAGAMGKPTWVLIPVCPDWRWMLYREDSPWYPSMRLFRQEQPGDWQVPIEKMRDALAQFSQTGQQSLRVR